MQYTWEDFQYAWIAVYVLAVLLIVGLLVARAKAQPQMRRLKIVEQAPPTKAN